MKSLLIADLLIIIAFFALAQPQRSISSNLSFDDFIMLTSKNPDEGRLPLELHGQLRYINFKDSADIEEQFFKVCAVRKKCNVILVADNGKMKILPQ